MAVFCVGVVSFGWWRCGLLFCSGFSWVGGGVVARGVPLDLKKWNGWVLLSQSLRKNISRCGCGKVGECEFAKV